MNWHKITVARPTPQRKMISSVAGFRVCICSRHGNDIVQWASSVCAAAGGVNDVDVLSEMNRASAGARDRMPKLKLHDYNDY